MSNEQLGNLDLVDREKRKARTEARKFLTSKWGDQTPTWDSLGADEQADTMDDYIKFLRGGQNATIVNELVRDQEVIHSMLRQLIKGLQHKAICWSSGRDADTFRLTKDTRSRRAARH